MSATSSMAPAEVRLKRFLHFGSEAPLCVPGDRFLLQCFSQEKLTSIEEILANSAIEKQGDAVNHILKVCRVFWIVKGKKCKFMDPT